MDLLAAIALAAKIAELALKVGADAIPFILKIKEWATTAAQPSQADFDWLNAEEKKYLDMLNDTSRDDPQEGV